MADSLFREGVDPYRVPELPAPTLSKADASAWRFLVAVGALSVLALLIPFAEVEPLQGRLVDKVGTTYRAPREGVVIQVISRIGLAVRAGDPILMLDTSTQTLQGALEPQLALAARQRSALASEAMRDEAAKLTQRAAQLDAQRDVLLTRRRALAEQRALQEVRTEALSRQFEALRPLRQEGYVSEPEYRSREANWIAARQDRARLEAELAIVDGELRDIAFEEDSARSELRERTRAARATQSREMDDAARLSGAAVLVVRASRDGVVSELPLTRGQWADQGQLLARLDSAAPSDLVALKASSRAISRIRVGQPVRLTFRGVSAAEGNAGRGRVVSVGASPDSLGFYPVSVVLEENSKLAGVARADPPQGSAVSASVILDRRSLASRALEPVRKAMRDRFVP